MAKENQAQTAVVKARQSVNGGSNRGVAEYLALADVEVRAEQAKQQELANMIAMASNPAACPFPVQDVRDRIKELASWR